MTFNETTSKQNLRVNTGFEVQKRGILKTFVGPPLVEMISGVLVACFLLGGVSACTEKTATPDRLQSVSVTDNPMQGEQIGRAAPMQIQNVRTTTINDNQENTSPTNDPGTYGEGSVNQGEIAHSETVATETLEITTSPDPYDGPFCKAQKSWKLRWPKTRPEQTALVQCPGTSTGYASRYCGLVKWPKEWAYWAFPNFQDCKESSPDEDEEPTEIPWCPRDTSYATLWPDTLVNTTATAKCPKNLTVYDDLNATRRCEWATVDGIKTAQWQAADLMDCIVSIINASTLIPADEVQQTMDDWLDDHSCTREVTTSALGTFEWNTTIVGGVSRSNCQYGFILPSKKILEFMEVSLWLTTTLNKLNKNLTASNLTEKLQQVGQNISKFAENLRDFIVNKSSEIIEDIVASNSTQSKLYNGLSDWLETWKDKFSYFSDQSEDSDNSRAARVRRSDDTGSVGNTDFFKWLTDEATRLTVPAALIVYSTVKSGKQSVTYDLRGKDKFSIDIDDLRSSLTGPDENGGSWPAKWRSRNLHQVNGQELAKDGEAQGGWSLKEAISRIKIPDITCIVEAFRNLSRTPFRMCLPAANGGDVIWDKAETWMCRSENATLSQDLDRAIRETKNFGLGSTADLTFIKVIVNLWTFIEEWRNTIPEVILMVIQVINHLLSLPEPIIPQHFSNIIIKTIENLPNRPLPNNVTSVKIITDNIVLAMEKVEQDTFSGALFASIKPNEPTEAYQADDYGDSMSSPSNGTKIGDNIFEHKTGALNESLQGLDLDNVDEYFYVPESIFTTNQPTQYNTCDGVNGTTASVNTSMLQFVVYENDQLFRAMDDEVAVTLAEDFTESNQADWKVTSRVMSATLGGHCVWGLKNPVIFSLKHHNPVGDGGSRLCVYWDFKERGGSGSWSTEGCRVSIASRDHTICECNHLTNYAVIIDIGAQLGRGSLPQEHSMALEIISYAGCSLSLIGLIITMGMLISVRKLREAKTTPTRLMLCLSLIISMTFYLTGIDQTSNPRACAAFACCIHYFTLVALMWMGVEGVYLYRNIVVVAMNPTRHMFKLCCTAAWGVPAIIVGCIAIFDLEAYGSNERCWISNSTVFFAAFLGPALLIVTLNFMVFFMVMWVLFRRPFGARRYTSGKEHREFARRRREIFGIISITALLGLTWILGSFSMGDVGVRLTSLYLFTIFNSAQGFFIFLFYGLLSFLTTRGIKSPHTGTPPLTNTAAKLSQFAVSTVALNKTILQIQQCRSRSKQNSSSGESIVTSCSDVQLEFGHDNPSFQPDLLPAKAKQEMFAGEQQPQTPDLTPCSFVLSAGILNAGNQHSLIYLMDSESSGTLWAGPQHSKKDEFVLGTGIIFCGKS
ncbi:uncharacterized protein LOC119730935 [Patiria miniata]|uniref:Uncharacterized protein n=1 Tax=Patiria miniata TaxID=46514 RepID=A0A914A933_PATMI|nr:uncharacterized protein LOC119730935 [Patiria miniata]